MQPFPYYKPLGYPEGAYRVGPLGRLNMADQIDTPAGKRRIQAFQSSQWRSAR